MATPLHAETSIPEAAAVRGSSAEGTGSPEAEAPRAVTILAIGDPHFKVSNSRETGAFAESVLRLAAERGPDAIVVLGDVLDRHETIHVSPLTRAVAFLDGLRAQAPVFLLVGNHDRKNNRDFLSGEHPFTALTGWEGVRVAAEPFCAEVGGHVFAFVPYVPPGRFAEALAACPGWAAASCVFAHQEFRGARMGALLSSEGDPWPLDGPLVVSGHIHDYQRVQPNVLYTGAPMQHAFGDAADKTVSLFSFSPGSWREERVDLGLPKKCIVRLRCAELGAARLPRGELKIVIEGTAAEIKSALKDPLVESWKRAGHKVAFKERAAEAPSPAPFAGQRFSALLQRAAARQPRLLALHAELFGAAAPVVRLALRPKQGD